MATTKRQAYTTLYLEWRVGPNETEDQARERALASIRERINGVIGEWAKPVEGAGVVTDADGEWLSTEAGDPEAGDLPDDDLCPHCESPIDQAGLGVCLDCARHGRSV